MARFKLSFKHDASINDGSIKDPNHPGYKPAVGYQRRSFNSFNIDEILRFINGNKIQELSFANNSLSEEKLQQLLSGLAVSIEGHDVIYKNIGKNIVRINLNNIGLKPENAKDIGRIIAAAAPNLQEINLDKNPDFFSIDSVAYLMSAAAHARGEFKQQGKKYPLEKLGSDITAFSIGKTQNADYKSKLAEYSKEWGASTPSSTSDSDKKESSKEAPSPKEGSSSSEASMQSEKASLLRTNPSPFVAQNLASPETKEKLTSSTASVLKAKSISRKINVAQTREELDYEIASKIPGEKGRLILAYADPKNGVNYNRNLSATYAKTIFVFGDNYKMWEKRGEALLEVQDFEKIKHPGEGQADILGGRLRNNVIGIPTCDVMDTAELKKYITKTIQKIKDEYIDHGYDVVIPTLKTGEINMGTGFALGRQPDGLQGKDLADFIASEFTRITGVEIPLYKNKAIGNQSKETEKDFSSSSSASDASKGKGKERERRMNTPSSRSSASEEEMKVLSPKGKEKESQIRDSKTLFKIDCKKIDKDTDAVGKTVNKDRNYNLAYLFEEIEKGKFDYVSFSRTDLSGLQCAKRDAKGKVISGEATEGELLAYFIAQNETVKKFDFRGTNVPDDFFKSLAINIKNKSISRPNSKFVLEHIYIGNLRIWRQFNDNTKLGFSDEKDGVIAEAKKVRVEAGKSKIGENFVEQLAKKIKNRTSINTIIQLIEGFNALNDPSGDLLAKALNTPTLIGKHNGITLLHHLAYESGSKFFTRSRHKYMKNVADVLLKAGLDPSEKDTKGRTAYVLAAEIGNKLNAVTGYSYQNIDLIRYLDKPTQEALDRRFVRKFVAKLKDGLLPGIGKKMEEFKAIDKKMKLPEHKDYFMDLLNRTMDIGDVKNTTLLKYATRPESYPDSDTFHANAARVAEQVIDSAGFAGGSTLLYALSQTQHDAKLVKVLVEKDSFVKQTLKLKNANGKGPLQLAAERKGNADVLKVLLATGECLFNDELLAYAVAIGKENLSTLNTYAPGDKSSSSGIKVEKRKSYTDEAAERSSISAGVS